nr:hypothetical protein MIMGU_mgv1a019867mg [Ipomoea batatas]
MNLEIKKSSTDKMEAGNSVNKHTEPEVLLVLENPVDAMDRKSSSLEDIGVGDPGIINGEIGQGVVGDEDAVGGQERGEAIVEVEALEMGEREALGDDMRVAERGREEILADESNFAHTAKSPAPLNALMMLLMTGGGGGGGGDDGTTVVVEKGGGGGNEAVADGESLLFEEAKDTNPNLVSFRGLSFIISVIPESKDTKLA